MFSLQGNEAKKKMLIHASNITGLGATQVVSSLVSALINQSNQQDMHFVFPNSGQLTKVDVKKHTRLLLTRRLPNALSRFIECMFPRLFYPRYAKTLILGDIPLRGFGKQVVFLHQSNIIKPHVNTYSAQSFSFKVMRKIFEWNLKYVHYVIVQSEVMKKQLLQSYAIAENQVKVIPQPAPAWFENIKSIKPNIDDGLVLFYPAAGYPHKNHMLINQLAKSQKLSKDVKLFIVTLNDKTLCGAHSKIKNIGQVSPESCMTYYATVNALFFPSVAESYGLPLVEAMLAGLPILCADLPYAHWMCEDEAIYFNPDCEKSAAIAITELKSRLKTGWQPDWHTALSKLPKSWDEVGKKVLNLLA